MKQEERLSESIEEELLLLRFPKELRTSLDRWDKKKSKPQKSKPQKKSKSFRWKRFIVRVFLLMFGLSLFSLWSLEESYQTQREGIKNHQTFLYALNKLNKQLRINRQSQNYNSLSRYLKKSEEVLRVVSQLRKEFCYYHLEKNAHKFNILQLFQRVFSYLRWLIDKYGQSFYQKWRGQISKKSYNAFLLLQRSCPKKLHEIEGKLKAEFWRSAGHFLRQAKIHLEYYNWCQTIWSTVQYNSTTGKLLNQIRTRQCKQTCYTGGVQECIRCKSTWRDRLNISQEVFETLQRTVDLEKRKRCRFWSGNKPSWDGLFHLGAYYWRVNRVLKYTNLLDKYNLCHNYCRVLRRRWGFQFQITTKPSNAKLYVRLWQKNAKAPTQTLRKISQEVQGIANGKPFWLPSLRFDLLKTIPSRHFWYFFHLIDPKTKKRAIIPLAPQAGKKFTYDITLQPIEIHHDGRESLRFIDISQRHSYLAFVRFVTLPWERNPQFSSPYCLSKYPTTSLPARTILSVFALNKQGQLSSKGYHLPLSGWIHYVKWSTTPKMTALFISSKRKPININKITSKPSASELSNLSLWKVPISQKNKGFFAYPMKLKTVKEKNDIFLPLAPNLRPSLLLKLTCPIPSSSFTFEDLVPNVPVPSTRIRSLYRLIDASKTKKTFVYLLASKNTHYSTFLLRRSLMQRDQTKITTLKYSFQQLYHVGEGIFLSGGTWGTPLQYYYPNKKIRTIMPSQPYVRYLDPTFHAISKRLFVIQEWKIRGNPKWQPTASFLISRKISGM